MELAPDRHPRRWFNLAIIYLLMLSFAITIQSLPPVLSLVISSESLSHTQAGLLMSLFALSGVVVSIPVGVIADRYGQKKIGAVGVLLILIGVAIFASGRSFSILALGRVTSGVGALTLMVLAARVLPQWFVGPERGTAFGIFNTAMPLGLIISFNALPFIAERFTWQTGIGAAGLVPLVTLLVFALAFTPAATPGPASQQEGFRVAFTQSGISIWILGLTWMCFYSAMLGFFTFTPDLLKSAGFSLTRAGLVGSMVMWPALLISPVVGYLTGRFGHREISIAIGGIATGLLILFLPQTTRFAAGMILLIGITQSLVPPPVYALASEVLPAHRHGLGFGIMSICATAGIMLGPFLAGLARDATGSYSASYAVMAGFGILTAVAITVLWLIRGRQHSKPS
ncbi:CynX/NimT family MFS transporter [Chloroflexota bacterium]